MKKSEDSMFLVNYKYKKANKQINKMKDQITNQEKNASHGRKQSAFKKYKELIPINRATA